MAKGFEVDMHGWLKVKSGAAYADCSERLFRDWLKDGLRHIRLRGTIRTKPEWIDAYLMRFEESGNQVDAIVDDVCKEVL